MVFHLLIMVCFLSKLVERVVARQLTSHINNNKLDNPHQSAYKPGHSTETALLSIKNEVHLSLAHGEPTALVLLDLSATFDTIDHISSMDSHKVLFWVRYCFHSIQHHLVKLFASTRILNSIFVRMTLSYTSISPTRMLLRLSPS